jgi:hypothetical protein
MNSKLIYCLTVLFFCLLSVKARAESARPIGFELYSWTAGSTWRYAVLEGTATQRSTQKIQSKANQLKNLTFLKGRLASIPAHEAIFWRVEPTRGFTLPSKETIQEIKDYAEGLQLKIILPGETNRTDPIDKILR